MGKIVSNFFMSLDGCVEAPDQWHMPYFNDEMGAALGQGMATNGLPMGRTLYEESAGFWPNSDDEFARVPQQPPQVRGLGLAADRELDNTTVVPGIFQLREAKDAADGDLVDSSERHALVRSLLTEGLIDDCACSSTRSWPATAATVRGRHQPRPRAREQRPVQHRRAELLAYAGDGVGRRRTLSR